jgi:predicted negative regulator of RcsB-dependent stress response
MNNTLNKKTPVEQLKRFVSDNKVILMFVVLSIVMMFIG